MFCLFYRIFSKISKKILSLMPYFLFCASITFTNREYGQILSFEPIFQAHLQAHQILFSALRRLERHWKRQQHSSERECSLQLRVISSIRIHSDRVPMAAYPEHRKHQWDCAAHQSYHLSWQKQCTPFGMCFRWHQKQLRFFSPTPPTAAWSAL